ncbi:MAG: M48 family metallopeptidase [Armatimonadetes bacterium]|nr:M48 family metallopeptidase [Armatimonadota bacterium]MCX7967427.1 M48 family metallopeptidase [Armatimonadota bacterium]MDW8142073.1 M48 family metallopeptidase [Armatimonadota bacterium]
MNRRFVLAVLLALFACIAATQSPLPQEVTEQERKLGEEAVKEFEGKVKIVNDHPMLPLIRQIVARLVPVTERPKMSYTVKIVEDNEPNAFTFPGGFMYVTTGLIKLAESEHELAAVLAHEIAHNTRLHAIRMIEKESRLSIPVLLAMLAAVFIRGETSMQAAQIVSQVVQVLMLGYSRDMEREADEVAFVYLQRAGFNPVGLLTFFEKLSRLEKQSTPPQFLPGYWTTHPALDERISSVKRWLTAGGMPINRRPITKALKVEVKEFEDNGRKLAALLLSGEEMCRFAPSEKQSALERAQEAAKKLDDALEAGAQAFDFQVKATPEGITVSVTFRPILVLTAADIVANQLTPEQLAVRIRQTISKSFLRERLSGRL